MLCSSFVSQYMLCFSLFTSPFFVSLELVFPFFWTNFGSPLILYSIYMIYMTCLFVHMTRYGTKMVTSLKELSRRRPTSLEGPGSSEGQLLMSTETNESSKRRWGHIVPVSLMIHDFLIRVNILAKNHCSFLSGMLNSSPIFCGLFGSMTRQVVFKACVVLINNKNWDGGWLRPEYFYTWFIIKSGFCL